MANVLEIIKNEITQDYYKNNFPNDGQRFVAWYMRNIHLLDQRQAKDAITDGANDKQIDAVYIDEDEQKIYIVQGKYYLGESVDATPVREVISAWSQFSNLAQLQKSYIRAKCKLQQLQTAKGVVYCSFSYSPRFTFLIILFVARLTKEYITDLPDNPTSFPA